MSAGTASVNVMPAAATPAPGAGDGPGSDSMRPAGHGTGTDRVPDPGRPSHAGQVPDPGRLSDAEQSPGAEPHTTAAPGPGEPRDPASEAPSAESLAAVVEHRIPVADGVSLRVREIPGASPVFVLVHGLSSNARLWDGVAGVIAAAGHRVLAIDLRSHGESDAPESGYDTATAADDVAAAARALGATGAIVAGQSWGGNVVVQVAARHPDVVSALALVDGGWADFATSFGSWEACERALRPPDIDGSAAETLRGYLRSAHADWEPWAIEATLANMRVGPDGTVTRRLSIPHHMSILHSMYADPPRAYYPDIRVPVLLTPALRGDVAVSREQVRQAAAAIADARVREYPGADHDIHAQHPRDLAADLLGFRTVTAGVSPSPEAQP